MDEIEEEMTKHLKGYPVRREELLSFQKTTLENDELIRGDIFEIKEQIRVGLSHPNPSARTIAMVGEIKDIVVEHNKKSEETMSDYLSWRTETDRTVKQLNELMPIVREQLLPAYNRAMTRDEAKKILRQDFADWSFWGKMWLLGVAIAGSVGIILRFWLKD